MTLNNSGAYAVNPDTKNYEYVESTFLQDLGAMMGEVGYRFPHSFKDGSIRAYGASVIAVEKITNVAFLAQSYGFEPTKILRSEGIGHHLVFEFESLHKKADWERYSKTLARIYGGKSLDHYFYEGNVGFVENVGGSGKPFDSFDTLRNAHTVFFKEEDLSGMSKSDVESMEIVNSLEIDDVARDIGDKASVLDLVNNVSVRYGFPYDYVLNSFDDPVAAKKFMNENYGTSFSTSVNVEKFSGDGMTVIEGKAFFSDEHGYYSVKESERQRQTDFFVRVHYRILRPEETVYVVSLSNPKTGDVSGKVMWPNTVNRAKFSEFFQNIGNFHFTGTSSFITEMHKKLSEYRDVPEVKTLVGYGFHDSPNVAVFDGCVFDVKNRVFTKKTNTDDDFLFNCDGVGYLVTDRQGTNIKETFKGMVPNIKAEKLVEMSDVRKFLDSLYSDHSGTLLLAYALGNMGYAMFADHDDITNRYPVFFAKGLTGSGKTTYVEIMQRMWGLSDASKSFQQTSNFTLSVLISYLRYVPVFVSEFRDVGQDVKTKGSTIRSMFDGTGQAKGRPDQTIVNYDFRSTMAMEGEEMFSDGALRTRCVQHRFLSGHKIDGDFNRLFNEGSPVLDGMLYTYLSLASKERYEEALKEGYELFKRASSSSRIRNNLKMMYAGCMAMDPSNRDGYVSALLKCGAFQHEDYVQNSTGTQILKAVSKFLEQSNDFYDDVYVTPKEVIISWNRLEEYVKAKRIDLSLNVETYKEHLEDMGYPVEYAEVEGREGGGKMVYGIIIPTDNIPKMFLMNQKIYAAHKAAQPKR